MDYGLSTSAYRSHPLVLGVVGRPNRATTIRFFEEALEARVLVRTRFMEARAIGPVEGQGTSGYHWGAAIYSSDRHIGWQDQSLATAAGLFQEGDQWVLFTDAVGINSVYLRECEGSLYFATRMAPLVALPGRLNVDWSAWSSIFVMGAPLGEETPFLEIRRLEGASGVAFENEGSTRRLSYDPRWLDRDPVEPATLGDAVRAALPPRSALPETPVIPLSGGWDSRLLAGLAEQSYKGQLRSWTSAADDGTDLDVPFAANVASALGMRHATIQQPKAGWPELATETRIRTQFETWLHPWFTPLFRHIRSEDRGVLDGLAGDVLIKGLFVNEMLMEAPPEQRLERLFQRLGYRPDRRLTGSLDTVPARAMVDLCRQSFLRIARRYSGHTSQLALTVLHTRTARVIATAPNCLLSPEVKTWLPFLDPEVLRVALNISPDEKTSGTLYRQVLRHSVPRVADLPSTNDPNRKAPSQSRRLQTGKQATSWMIDSLLASKTLVDFLLPNTFAGLRQIGQSWQPPDPHIERILMAGSLFAQWERFYRGRIVTTSPPW